MLAWAINIVDCRAAIASRLTPTGAEYICERLVGWRAAFAGKPAPTGIGDICKKLVGWQAWLFMRTHFPVGAVECNEAAIFWLYSLQTRSKDRSLRQLLQLGWVHSKEIGRLAGRLRWQASSYRKAKADRRTPAAFHHSTGRALARLQLLILIHPPPRQAEWRCSSGDGRAAPFDAVELIACRSKRSRPEGNAPG